MQYAVVIEQGEHSFEAYVPDLPGCVAVDETEAEVRQLIREPITFHLEGMREDRDPIPVPSAHVEYVEITSVA